MSGGHVGSSWEFGKWAATLLPDLQSGVGDAHYDLALKKGNSVNVGNRLSEEDRNIVNRARKIERFLSQPGKEPLYIESPRKQMTQPGM